MVLNGHLGSSCGGFTSSAAAEYSEHLSRTCGIMASCREKRLGIPSSIAIKNVYKDHGQQGQMDKPQQDQSLRSL